MAVTEVTVRRIVREEVGELLSEIERLTGANVEERARDDRLLSVEEAAQYLGGLPVATVRNLVKRKQIEHVKIGRSTAFRRQHLDAYIEDHTLARHENPWGLTDGALRNLREGDPRDRARKNSEAMNRITISTSVRRPR